MNTIDIYIYITNTNRFVKLELFAPTERYRTGAPACKSGLPPVIIQSSWMTMT